MTSEQNGWQPVFDQSEAENLKAKLDEIATILVNKKNSEDDKKKGIGLIGGLTGEALFLFYYAKYTQDMVYYDKAMELLTDVFDAINDGFAYHTFAAGLAGVGWAVEHLVQTDFIEADPDEILEDIDTYLHKAMILDIQEKGNYDFLHGASGCAIYFLNRLGNDKAGKYLAEYIDELEKKSEKEENGAVKWKSVLSIEEGFEGYNLSLSHGLASIIAFLANTNLHGIHKEKSASLLKGAIQYMMSNSLDTTKFQSNFPSWIREGEPLSHSRMAWCYGDLGIGISLYQAALSLDDKDLEERAIAVFQHAAKRKDLKENAVVDAGLCHGGAGIAHIFNRMYNYTGIEEFRETARYWFNATLALATHEDGFAGYKAWHTEKYGGWVSDGGILEGIGGIGLGILSAISDIEPEWDRCLLCS